MMTSSNPDSNPHPEDQRKKPTKRGSQIFSSFQMDRIVLTDDDLETEPMTLQQDQTTMEESSHGLLPQEDRENIPSEPEQQQQQQQQPKPAMTNSLDLPGGPNYRPLVGGYAAAAYEAARSLHYSSTETKTSNDKDRRHRTSASIP